MKFPVSFDCYIGKDTIKLSVRIYMKNHILIEKAKMYSIPNQNFIHDGYSYRAKEGYWADNSSNIAMMRANIHLRPTTKKCDIETGEDQKGE